MNSRMYAGDRPGRASAAAPRGASRIAPPAGRQKRNRPLSGFKVNWRLVGRVLSSLLAIVALGVMLEGWKRVQPYLNQPIARVVIKGELSPANQKALQASLESFGGLHFMSLDIHGMQQALGHMGWVDKVSISRVWPDQLMVEVSEQEPIARWGQDRWLNNRGQVFSTDKPVDIAGMPMLQGPEGSESKVMQQYWLLSQTLRAMGYGIVRLELKQRGSWFVSTQQGFELWLGREDIVEKMRRFTAIHEKELKQQMNRIERVDLRYANGLAVAWRSDEDNAAVQ